MSRSEKRQRRLELSAEYVKRVEAHATSVDGGHSAIRLRPVARAAIPFGPFFSEIYNHCPGFSLTPYPSPSPTPALSKNATLCTNSYAPLEYIINHGAHLFASPSLEIRSLFSKLIATLV